jgi:hypothetical protein
VAGAPVVNPKWESCDAIAGQDADAPALPRLDDSFQPVSAVLCLTASRQRATGGADLVATERRADDVAALVAALRLPDEEPTSGACTMELVTVPWLALLDADGRWIRPGVPVDSCRKPRIEVRTALGRLRTTTVSSRVYVEADGCRRVLINDVALRQGSPKLISLLFS